MVAGVAGGMQNAIDPTDTVIPAGLIQSSHVFYNVAIKIGTLSGPMPPLQYTELVDNPLLFYTAQLGGAKESCVYVECQLRDSAGRPVCLPVHTPYKPFQTGKDFVWNHWMTFSVHYCDIPLDCRAFFSIYDLSGIPGQPRLIGTTEAKLFDKFGCLKKDTYELKVNTSSGNTSSNKEQSDQTKPESDQVPTFPDPKHVRKQYKRFGKNELEKSNDFLDKFACAEAPKLIDAENKRSNSMYLLVDFPKFAHAHPSVNCDIRVKYCELVGNCFTSNTAGKNYPTVGVYDPEVDMPNLIEEKHKKLIIGGRKEQCHPDLKPDAPTRTRLYDILCKPLTEKLSEDEKNLVWQYRYHLTSYQNALVKFVRATEWQDEDERVEAMKLIEAWKAPRIQDALELLGEEFSSSYQAVCRKFAVKHLQSLTQADLHLYLLQLVQALRFESEDAIKHKKLRVLVDEPQDSGSVEGSLDTSVNDLPNFVQEGLEEEVHGSADLAVFLVEAGLRYPSVAHDLHWYLECESHDDKTDERVKGIFYEVKKYLNTVVEHSRKPEAAQIRQHMEASKRFMDFFTTIIQTVRRLQTDRPLRLKMLKEIVHKTPVADENVSSDSLDSFDFKDFEPFPHPLDPSIYVTGIKEEGIYFFKSAMEPVRLYFKTTDPNYELATIFKLGDDLRQDQMILQTVALMDQILKEQHLDLRLTPYRCCSTNFKGNTEWRNGVYERGYLKCGFLEFVPSESVQSVLQVHGKIKNWMEAQKPDHLSMEEHLSEMMDNYVRSCAGYSVVTYILGVGDRHLENLLLTKNGRLFHIDFGFILDRDPKPFPPPMKVTKEMVEGMGGVESTHYKNFKTFCFDAFMALRRSANLILSLFNLMVHSNIPDICLEPDKTVKKVQDKFVLHLSDEEATAYLQGLIDQSVKALFPELMDQLHKLAQGIRK